VDAFICYKQKCKVVSLNLAHPVYETSMWHMNVKALIVNWRKAIKMEVLMLVMNYADVG